jgi:hypothetical protein
MRYRFVDDDRSTTAARRRHDPRKCGAHRLVAVRAVLEKLCAPSQERIADAVREVYAYRR